MRVSFPTDDFQSFLAWVRACPSPEALREVLVLGVGRMSRTALREAPREAITAELVETMLEGLRLDSGAHAMLVELASNPHLSEEVRSRLWLWCREKLWEVSSDAAEAVERGRYTPLHVAGALEAAGHSPPTGFWARFRQALRRPENQPEWKLPLYGRFLLEQWFGLEAGDIPSLYSVLHLQEGMPRRLVQHPASTPEHIRVMLRAHDRDSELLAVALEREEVREYPPLRYQVVQAAWLPCCRVFLPYATSEEFVEMVYRASAFTRVDGFELLRSREASPEEFRAMIRRVGAREPERAISALERFATLERAALLGPDEMLPLLQAPDSQVRLRAQAVCARVGQVRESREEGPTAPGSRGR